MKIKSFIIFLVIAACASCNNSRTVPNTDIDVARAFIKDVLDNNFAEAKSLVLDEDINNQYFDLSRKNFEGKNKEELKKYKESDIIINELKNVNDSVTIVNYSNSYKKDIRNEIKVVKVNGKWLVDLKHTFQEEPKEK
ncbi:DUF4878 domain-containing protein [Ferruginibacter paludis]|uniref:DUF4878 domain-containing protein n=1 Tax=Ferruginibacter paludis TaxID=1310417 RepID=UPI0025B49553|nr:DUF4878 domain-containing protein [Ferruginibacter paludis]MDN3657542.1 DUF4878 domain-containing protein [Ferruginibacter paludis]